MNKIAETPCNLKLHNNTRNLDYYKNCLFIFKVELNVRWPVLKKLFDIAFENDSLVKQYHFLENNIGELKRNPKYELRLEEILKGICFGNQFKKGVSDG